MKEYKLKRRAGIDDLEGQLGDFATEWWTNEDHKKWNDDKPNRDKRNQEYIDKLKSENRFGEEYDLTFALQENSLFDDDTSNKPESYRMVFLDLNKENENN